MSRGSDNTLPTGVVMACYCREEKTSQAFPCVRLSKCMSLRWPTPHAGMSAGSWCFCQQRSCSWAPVRKAALAFFVSPHQSLVLSVVQRIPLLASHSGEVASCQGTRCGLHLLLRHTSEGVPLSAWPHDALPALGLCQQEGCHQMQRLQLGPRL